MRNLAFLFTAMFLIGNTVSASNNNFETHSSTTNFVNGYGNSFIFVENNIEFSVFRDGQFDFYLPNYGPNVNVAFSSPNVAISFNSGYDYNAYVQYDDFGAVVQILNTPIYYDYYGRVSQIGNVFVNYNHYGQLNRIGGLNIYYRNNVYSHYSGFINIYNRGYVYRPWHQYYAIPAYNYCIVRPVPYRTYYQPVRYTYHKPYYNNYRHVVDINSRRGQALVNGRRTNDARVSDRYRTNSNSQLATSNTRRSNVNNAAGRNISADRTGRSDNATLRSNSTSRNISADRAGRSDNATLRSNSTSRNNGSAVRATNETRTNNSAVRTANNDRNFNDTSVRTSRTVNNSSATNNVNRNNNIRSSAANQVTNNTRNVSQVKRTEKSNTVRKPSAQNTRKSSNTRVAQSNNNSRNNQASTTRRSRQ